MNRTPQSTAAVLLWLALPGLDAQTKVDLRTQGKGVDFSQASATAPFKTGSTLPATCQIGEMFFKADAPAGQNMFGCTSANTWTQQAGSGGGGGASAPEDFRPAVSVNTLTTSAGVARIGHQKYAIAAGGVQFSGGSGDCKTFISETGVLTTHCVPGISGTPTGSMVLAIVTTPAYPSGGIPVADLTVSSGTVTLDSDDRAFLSTRALQAGAGISITDSSGVLSVATDSAIVPTLAGPNVFTGESDFSASTKFRVRTGSGPPSAGTCDEAAEVGGMYIRNDAGTTNASHYICSKTGASTYAWELTQGAGGGGGNGLGDPGANGMVARTALNTTVARTITGTANKIAVSNGSGVTGDPTLSIGSDVVDKTAATTYTPGAKQTFQASTSTAGANAGCAALPSAPAAGDIACDSADGNKLKQYNGSGWVTLAQGMADPGSSGVLARTGLNTTAARTITGTANKIVVSNGSGVSGDPTLSIGSDVVDRTAATSYTPGAKQTFQASASTAGANAGCAALPSAPATGDIACDSADGNKLKQYNGSGWVTLAQGMADPGANGLLARTALNTTAARVITGTANEIAVADGDGAGGNPTVSIASTFDVSGKTSTKPAKTGTSLPGTCAVGEQYFKSDATAGQNLYFCAAANTWTQMSGGGGGAPTGAQYVTLASDANLSAERVLTPRDYLTATDDGPNGNYTLDWTPLDRGPFVLSTDCAGGGTTVSTYTACGGSWGVYNSTGTGSMAYQASVADHPGILRVTTGANTSDAEGFKINSDTFPPLNNLAGWEYQAIVRTVSAADVAFRIGMGVTGYFGNSSVHARFDTSLSDTVWKFQCCSGGSCTTQSSTITPADNGWYRIRIRSTTAGTILFSVNGGSEVSTSTNLPTVALAPGMDVTARTTGGKSLDVDWVAFRLRGLGR